MMREYNTLQEFLDIPENKGRKLYCIFREPFGGRLSESLIRRQYVKWLKETEMQGGVDELVCWEYHQQVLRGKLSECSRETYTSSVAQAKNYAIGQY